MLLDLKLLSHASAIIIVFFLESIRMSALI